MQRIYLESLKSSGELIEISGHEIINQLVKVLRYNVGDVVLFFNGNDKVDFKYEIKRLEKKVIVFHKLEEIFIDNEINFNLTLFQSIPNKIEKLENIVQKGTEIGVNRFIFFRSDRSQKINLSENKIERLKKIIIESVEQSGRNIIPEFCILDKLDKKLYENGENIFFHTNGVNSEILKNLKIDYSKNINLFIGPEGGWSEKEIFLFNNSKFKNIYLGNRILRTETAGLVTAFYLIQNK